jgi:hypothetical protein
MQEDSLARVRRRAHGKGIIRHASFVRCGLVVLVLQATYISSPTSFSVRHFFLRPREGRVVTVTSHDTTRQRTNSNKQQRRPEKLRDRVFIHMNADVAARIIASSKCPSMNSEYLAAVAPLAAAVLTSSIWRA